MALSCAPIVVGLLALSAACGSKRDPGRVDPQGSAGPGSGTGKAAISAPEGPRLGGSENAFGTPVPVLPDAGTPIDAPSHRDVFARQTRDDAWANRTERELRARITKLELTTVGATDCRTDQCELTIAGSTDDVSATLARLENTGGLRDLAKSVMLSAPEQKDGVMTIRVYAIYDRTP